MEKEDQIIATLADTSGTAEHPAFQGFRNAPDKTSKHMTTTNMSAMALASQADSLR